MTTRQLDCDPGSEEHAPELYLHDAIADKVDGFDGIHEEHLEFYEQAGYLALENAFNDAEVEAALAGLVDLKESGL